MENKKRKHLIKTNHTQKVQTKTINKFNSFLDINIFQKYENDHEKGYKQKNEAKISNGK